MHDELDALHGIQQDDINSLYNHPQDNFSHELYDLSSRSMHIMQPSVAHVADPPPPSHIPTLLSEFKSPDDQERMLLSSTRSSQSSQSPPSSGPSLTSSPISISLHSQNHLSTSSPTSFVSSSSSLASALCHSAVSMIPSSSSLYNGGGVNSVSAPGLGSTSDLSDNFSSPSASLYNGNISNIAGNGNIGTPSNAGTFSGSVSLSSSVHDSVPGSLSSSTSLSASSSAFNFPESSADFNLILPSASRGNIVASNDSTNLHLKTPSPAGNASESSDRTSIDQSTFIQFGDNDASFFKPFVNKIVEKLHVAQNSFSSKDIFDCVTTIEEGKQILDKLKALALHSHRGENSEETWAVLENGSGSLPVNSTGRNTDIDVIATSQVPPLQPAETEFKEGLDDLNVVVQQADLQSSGLALASQQQLTVDISGDGTRKRCASSLAGDRVMKALKLEPTEESVNLDDIGQAHNTLPMPMSVEITSIPLPSGQQRLPLSMDISGSEDLLSSEGHLSVSDVPLHMIAADSQQVTLPPLAIPQSISLTSQGTTVPTSVPMDSTPPMLQHQPSTIQSAASSVPSTRPGSPSLVPVGNINMDILRSDGNVDFSMSYMQLGNMALNHPTSNASSHSVPLSSISSSSSVDISATGTLPIAPIVHSQAHASAFTSMDGSISYGRPSRPMRSASLSYPLDPTVHEYPIPRDFQYRPEYMNYDYNAQDDFQMQNGMTHIHAPQSVLPQPQVSLYGRRASASVSGSMSAISSPVKASEVRHTRSRTLTTQVPGSVSNSNTVSPSGAAPISSYRSPSGSADELDEGYDNGDYDSDAESGEIWYTPSPIYSNGVPSMSMFGFHGTLEGLIPSQQSELSRVGILGQNGHYGPNIDSHDKVQSELDVIFFDFMNRICSNLEATDSKGELIHQTLMAKKMQRLDESPDFRPFKFRIQAFTNAFLEELASKGYPEDKIPMKKVRNYLWNQPYISRFNEDGKKAKSKGNHIWHVDAKKKLEGGWEFRPFHRKFAGAPPAMAYVGARWSWSPRVWDPQSARPNVPIHFSSPSLPSWLQWVDGTLTGVPTPDAQSCEITVEARFVQDGREELLSQVFHIAVGNMLQSNIDTSFSVQSVRRPSLSGDPRRINSDPAVQQTSMVMPRFAPLSQSVMSPVATSTSVTEVPGQPRAIMTGALESVTQKVHAEFIHSVSNIATGANQQIEQLVKQKHVLEVTASVMDPKTQVIPTVTQSDALKAVAEHVVLLATQKVEVDHSTAAALSSFSTGIPQSAAPPPPLITEISAATENAVAQAVQITGPLSSEIDVMKTAGSLLEQQRAFSALDIVPVSAPQFSVMSSINQGQSQMSQNHMNSF